MTEKKGAPYGTLESEPDEKAGVEVGGGDKAAAAVDRKAREEAEPGGSDDDGQPDPNKDKTR